MLEGYSALSVINKQMLKLLGDADDRLLSTTAQWNETRGSGTAKDSIGKNIAAIHSAAERLGEVSDSLGVCLDILLESVIRVGDVDPLAAKVLSMRYMEPGRTPEFDEIAEELGYSYDHVVRKHADGLDLVSEHFERNMPSNAV